MSVPLGVARHVVPVLTALALLGCGVPAEPEACTPLSQPLPAPLVDDADRAMPESADDAGFLFDQVVMHAVDLIVAPEDMAILNAQPAAEVYVPGSLVFNGVTYGPVGVRYKGSFGAFAGCTSGEGGFWDISGPKACPDLNLKVSFNHYDSESRFFGLKKLLFHAMRQDASLMRERLGYWLFRKMGVVAPRANHVALSLNGEPLGAYLNVEYLDGGFVDAHFDDGDGHLYKETWPSRRTLAGGDAGDAWRSEALTEEAIFAGLRTHEDDEDVSVDRLHRFAQAITQSDPDAKARAIQLWMSVENTMRFMVTDRFIGADDGPCHFYCDGDRTCSNHNVYLYTEENADRVWLIPWDLDNAFVTASDEMTPADYFLKLVHAWDDDTAPCAPTRFSADALEQMPASCDALLNGLGCHFKGAYIAAAQVGLEGPFSAAQIDGALEAWSAQIIGAVEAGHAENPARPSIADWEAGRADLEVRIGRLREALNTAISETMDAATEAPESVETAWPALRVNEVSPVGEGEDWIELHNPTDEAVDIGGWYITDDNPRHLRVFRPGRTIAAGEHLVLHRGAPDHFSFGLGKADAVMLHGPDSALVDSVSWTKDDLDKGESWARAPGEDETFFSMTTPTPGEPNVP
ncbi:MAG: CotH kinase family protein [Myxococcota bacterium]